MKGDHALNSNPSGNTLGTAVIDQKLLELIDSGILNKLSQQKYSFNNKLTWEVVYDAVMFSEKRRLHNLVGLYIESKNKENLDNVADLLLHHFESGQNHQKTVFYGALAGDRAALMFAAEEAIHSYNRALDALKQLAVDKPIDRSLVLEKCGDVYRNTGKYQLAVEKYHAAFTAWGVAADDGKVEYVPWEITPVSRNSNLCHKISVSYEHASNYDEAFSWINKAVEFLPEDSENTAPRVYAAKSAIHFRKGEYEDSVNWGERATVIAEKSGNSGDIAYSHNILANTFIEIGKLQDAIQHLKRSVAISEEAQDFMGMSTANNNLGACYMYSDNLEYAIKHYQVALDADIRTQNDAMMAIDHNNLGEVYIMQGRLEKSEALFRKVINAHKKGYTHDALAGYAMMNISRCNLYDGDVDKASDIIDQALDLIRDAGVKAIYLEAQLQCASVLLAQGLLEDALKLCNSTKQEIELQGINLLRTKANRILAKVLQEKGEASAALETINSSINLANSMGSKFEEGKSLNELARMLIEQGGSMTDAGANLDRAESIFSQIGAARELAYTESLKTRLEEQME